MEGTLASIQLFGGNFAPRTWAFCQGQLESIAQNQALFSLVGTIYGGDGRTTFGLPDLRGRTAISPGMGPGLSDRIQGQRSGTETVTLNIIEMPSHNHAITSNGTISAGIHVTSGDGDTNNPNEANSISSSVTFNPALSTGVGAPYTSLVSIAGGIPSSTINNGGSQPHNNMQPYLAIPYIICLQGLYPARN